MVILIQNNKFLKKEFLMMILIQNDKFLKKNF